MVDQPPDGYSTQRYLAAKRTVDDRALNARVFEETVAFLSDCDPPAEVVEVAAGIGTMLERLLERDALPGEVEYTMLDIDPANIAAAEQRLTDCARSLGYVVESRDGQPEGSFRDPAPSFGVTLSRSDRRVQVRAGTADAFPFAAGTDRTWDLLIAAAFLDIVPGSNRLETLFEMVPGGGYYTPITFDGASRFVPGVDRLFDRRLDRAARNPDRMGPATPPRRRTSCSTFSSLSSSRCWPTHNSTTPASASGSPTAATGSVRAVCATSHTISTRSAASTSPELRQSTGVGTNSECQHKLRISCQHLSRGPVGQCGDRDARIPNGPETREHGDRVGLPETTHGRRVAICTVRPSDGCRLPAVRAAPGQLLCRRAAARIYYS